MILASLNLYQNYTQEMRFLWWAHVHVAGDYDIITYNE